MVFVRETGIWDKTVSTPYREEWVNRESGYKVFIEQVTHPKYGGDQYHVYYQKGAKIDDQTVFDYSHAKRLVQKFMETLSW